MFSNKLGNFVFKQCTIWRTVQNIQSPFQYLTHQTYFYIFSLNVRKKISYINFVMQKSETQLPLSVSFFLQFSSLILAISLFLCKNQALNFRSPNGMFMGRWRLKWLNFQACSLTLILPSIFIAPLYLLLIAAKIIIL